MFKDWPPPYQWTLVSLQSKQSLGEMSVTGKIKKVSKIQSFEFFLNEKQLTWMNHRKICVFVNFNCNIGRLKS